jgi:hypothetical protein
MVDTAREAISRCLEMVTKSQIDPPTMSQVLQQGLGK